MNEDDARPAQARLSEENQKLRWRVFELEEEIRRRPQAARDPVQDTAVRKLIERKDVTLDQYARQLDEKRADFRKAVADIEQQKKQLELSLAALRLYQGIFEEERAAMIGVNREGRIVLYNLAAEELLGEKFKETLHAPLADVDFGAYDPSTPAMVKEALEGGRPGPRTLRVRDRQVTTSVRPIGQAPHVQGALVRIEVVSGGRA